MGKKNKDLIQLKIRKKALFNVYLKILFFTRINVNDEMF